ncbi:PH domain-containing protein [Dactylosporangium darangshiense]
MTERLSQPLSQPRQRLHPLTPLVRGAKLVALAAVAVSWRGLSDLGLEHWLMAMAAILILAVVVSAVVWAVTGYEVVGRELRVHEGLLSRRVRAIPLDRVQAIDVVRPALARVFGLAELRLEVIGGGKAEAPLAYLTVAGATQLRASLLGLATGAAGGAEPAAERTWFTVDNRRLLVAQLLTPQVLAVPVGAAFVLWPALAHPDWTLIGAASTITAFLGVFQVPVRRILDEWDFRIAADSAALRLRQGLLNKRSQSVPPRRVQGVKVTWPLLWRLPGWARAHIDVAGYGGDGEEQLRAGTLVPVAGSADAVSVAAVMLGAAVDPRPAPLPIDAAALPVSGPPRRAVWLAPVRVVPHRRGRHARRGDGAGGSADAGPRRGAAGPGPERPRDPGPAAAPAVPGHRHRRHRGRPARDGPPARHGRRLPPGRRAGHPVPHGPPHVLVPPGRDPPATARDGLLHSVAMKVQNLVASCTVDSDRPGPPRRSCFSGLARTPAAHCRSARG